LARGRIGGAHIDLESVTPARDTACMRSPARIRASDAERESVVGALRTHYAAGRLDERELEARASRAYTAERRGELLIVLADLPLQRSFGFSREAVARRVGRVHRFLLRGHAATFAAVNGLLVGVWALGGAGTFWPALYLVPSAALLTWHWLGGRMLSQRLLRWRIGSRPT
jgi:hypothetical protein